MNGTDKNELEEEQQEILDEDQPKEEEERDPWKTPQSIRKHEENFKPVKDISY
jgi:hypothetical protein